MGFRSQEAAVNINHQSQEFVLESDIEKDPPQTPSRDNNSEIALNGALEPPND